MTRPDPLYTPDNCHTRYRLYWSLALFPHHPLGDLDWTEPLRQATEGDGVRVLRHRVPNPATIQFTLSTRPAVAPAAIVRSVKARLQYLVRQTHPKAFHRNYRIESIGSNNRKAVEGYVADQLSHHQMADPRFQATLAQFQVHDPTVDLSAMRRSAHGQFRHNLHLVFVNSHRWMETREDVLRGTRDMLRRAARKKEHLFSRASVFCDHVHVAVGCGIAESPEVVALGYLNNLAYAQGMKAAFQYGYYAGTFGEYDLGATRQG